MRNESQETRMMGYGPRVAPLNPIIETIFTHFVLGMP